MDNTTWESLVIEVNEYLQADQTLDAGLRQVGKLNLQIGTNNPNEREAAQGALKALLKEETELRSDVDKSLLFLQALESLLTAFVALLKKQASIITTMML